MGLIRRALHHGRWREEGSSQSVVPAILSRVARVRTRHKSRDDLMDKFWAMTMVCRLCGQKTETVGFQFPVLRHYPRCKHSPRLRPAAKSPIAAAFSAHSS